MTSSASGGQLVNLGDINADGYDDFIVGSGEASGDTTNFVYFGGPNLDTIPDLILPDHTYLSAPAGDFNGDGYPDFMTSLFLQSSGYSYVNIYFGGPDVDSIPDVRINVWEMGGYFLNFGMGIAALGDVNGDGVDDIGVGAIEQYNHGVVFIFAGQKDPNDVPYHHEPTLPQIFSLNQNFPNPFNPTTTISFDLPKRSATKLTIFNICGEHVATLVDRELAAGSYRLEWDGRNAAGSAVASGVYLYRLETAEAVQTRKMLLLK